MTEARSKPTGLRRLINAFGNTNRGLRGAWREEAAFRQECALAAVLLPLACWLARSAVEFALLCGPIVLVLVVELLNSAVEAVVDRIGQERHDLSGLAKDMGSAAVFGSFVLLALNWAAILIGRL
jgi:diacylglycerol kinase (ATP)